MDSDMAQFVEIFCAPFVGLEIVVNGMKHRVCLSRLLSFSKRRNLGISVGLEKMGFSYLEELIL